MHSGKTSLKDHLPTYSCASRSGLLHSSSGETRGNSFLLWRIFESPGTNSYRVKQCAFPIYNALRRFFFRCFQHFAVKRHFMAMAIQSVSLATSNVHFTAQRSCLYCISTFPLPSDFARNQHQKQDWQEHRYLYGLFSSKLRPVATSPLNTPIARSGGFSPLAERPARSGCG